MGAVFAIIRDLPTPQARRALFLIAIYHSLGRHYLGLPMHFDE
ncbi:Signal recognition particle, subunit Ffh [Pseudomonas sp. R2-37-08W]|nr:Signal recognition particle, subunit Ffh [Pseudomonas sp. R2-37-08W]